ncbi:hypothetical protein [Stenomitos frigidus]|uniref:DUF3862 domain-containing protein n=1 Tax=Stenomitos frigidus ULC18 TaxID=2107698 RepID=A0A2T1EE02_9CYAN|nr:hypothetical protein [Stenomitos frigidus]PSB30928.1 hypothetical protein C7B82_07910 [Stenomitos frigidus ULC18]
MTVVPSSPGNEPPNLLSKLLSIAFSLGIAFGTGFGYGYAKYITAHPPMQLIGRVEYERLQQGMSTFQVEALLGSGVETQSSPTEVTYTWKNQDKSEITIVFKNGYLYNKKQSGLK